MARRQCYGVVIVALAALLHTAVYAANDTTYPVVPIPDVCLPYCAQFPSWISGYCVGCIAQLGLVHGFNDTYLPPIQRYPLYEYGYTNQAAFVAVAPNQTQQYGIISHLYSTLNNLWANRSQTQATLCFPYGSDNCERRKMAPEMDMNATTGLLNIPPGAFIPCYKKQGWLKAVVPGITVAPPCEGVDNYTHYPTALQRAEQLAAFYPNSRNLSNYQPTALRYARQYFTNVTAAADSLWDQAQSPNSFLFLFHNITTNADLNRLRKLYGADWNPAWMNLYRRGQLVEFDLTFLEGMNTTEGLGNKSRWPVVPHAVMQYVNNGTYVTLRALAVRLSNAPADYTAYEVYTPRKSKSAFITACWLAKTQITFFTIYVGHVYQMHTIQSAAGYALYNAVEPYVPLGKSTHPVRKMADAFWHPYWVGIFNIGLYAGGYTPSISPLVNENAGLLAKVYEKYTSYGGPLPGEYVLANMYLEKLVERSGLTVDKFTSVGGKAWDLWPHASWHLAVRGVTDGFAEDYVDNLYANDAAVANDAGIQEWVRQMLDPHGANLRKINAKNQIKTKAELSQFLSHMLSLTVAHLSASTPDYVAKIWNIAGFPFCQATNSLPDPSTEYSLQEILALGSDTELYSSQVVLTSFYHLGINPVRPQWVAYKPENGVVPPPFTESATPDYDGYPFYPSSDTNAKHQAVNAAVSKFRKDVPQMFAENEHCKSTHTQLSDDPNKMAVMTCNTIFD